MRIDRVEQMLRELGKLVVQLELDPRREKRDALEQTLDIGVGLARRVDAEAGASVG